MLPAAIGRDDDRDFSGESPIEPLQRLGRYVPNADGGYSFEPVEAGSLSRNRRVYVFVHGWIPGSRSAADQLFAEAGSVQAWNEQVSNRSGESLAAEYTPLLAALAQRDPDSAVLWFSWVDQSGTETGLHAARDSFRTTGINGRRLAVALQQAFGRSSPQVHLIGHSHGSVVATHAALALEQPPRHLTVLDCPEGWMIRTGGAAGLLDQLLIRLNPQRGRHGTFVDNYASVYGGSYHSEPGLHQVVDVRLTPKVSSSDPASPVSQAHHYPVAWYTDSILNGADHGFGWSPMVGYDTRELKASYLQRGDSALLPLTRADGSEGSGTPDFTLEPVDMSEQSLTKSEPDLAVSLRVDESAVLLDFEYDISHPGRDTRLQVAVDHELRLVAAARHPIPARGRYLRIQPDSAGEVLVQFRLVDSGTRTRVDISQLRVVCAPKPPPRNYSTARFGMVMATGGAIVGASAAVVVMGAIGILRRRRC